ncbi:MAG: DegT/DnrJ/EryC1/StrS family aminotransferase [Bacteroidota bacterium]
MPGFEIIGAEEQKALNDIFTQSNGVLFAHGFDVRRNNIFRVRDFERDFSSALGIRKSAACTSGTAAIYIAMKAMGIKPGDEVITQSFTFIATIEAILACNAVPVVVDIDETYNMSPAALENAITSKTRMIIPVHMLGNPASMNEINAIAAKHNLLVLEDACEALGATYNNRPVGGLAHAAAFSLDFGKTITTGEGGMITSDNEDLITQCMQFVDHGHELNPAFARGNDTASFFGFNFRMSEMQAAVGIEQVKKLKIILTKNRENKNTIKSILKQSDKITFRKITDEKGELADTIIFYFDKKTDTQTLLAKMSENKIGTKNVPDALRWHFSLHWKHVWESTGFYKSNYTTAWSRSADLLERSVALPVMVNMTKEECTAYGEKILLLINNI